MSKSYPVYWTKEASVSYLESVLFILEKWTSKEVEHFEILTNELLVHLSNNLKLCPEIRVLKVRKCTISYQTSLVYRISGNAIELIAFVDNRSDHNY